MSRRLSRLLLSLWSLLSRLLLVVLGVIIPLLVLEGAIRWLDIAPPADLQPPLWAPHPSLGWFHVPNQGGVSYSEYREFRAPVHINARGLRDRELLRRLGNAYAPRHDDGEDADRSNGAIPLVTGHGVHPFRLSIR